MSISMHGSENEIEERSNIRFVRMDNLRGLFGIRRDVRVYGLGNCIR